MAIVGWNAWQNHREAASAIPTFDDPLPATNSYWVSGGDALDDILAGPNSAGPYRWRAQRGPESDAIVVEYDAGFAEVDGERVLVTPTGTWIFDRLSGATSPTEDVSGRLHDLFDTATKLITFDDIVSRDLRPYASIVDREVLPASQSGAEGELTRYEFEIDRLGFAKDDRAGFVRWVTMVGVFGSDPDGADLDGNDLGFTDPRLDVVVDEAGLVWSWQLRVNGGVALEYRLLELSETPFIPPDPNAVFAPAIARDPASVPLTLEPLP